MTNLDPFAAAMSNMQTNATPPAPSPATAAPGTRAAPQNLTRAQRDLAQAVALLEPLQGTDTEVKKNYLRRVKDFPALVMQVGLSQAVAFSVDKASKNDARGQAHRHLLNHLHAVWQPQAQGQPVNLETGAGRDALLALVQDVPTSEYLHRTRRTLAAWVYLRRLAQSILDPDGKLSEERDE